MELYAAIDLHSNNSVVVVLDENDRQVYRRRLPNSLEAIVAALRSCAGDIQGVAVESTFNWYWLVDGLRAEGFAVQLVNTAAVKQYDGLKHSGDFDDARHLAHLLHLGILPTGYIYPREARALRDLARKRCQLVRTRTQQILCIHNLLARNLGQNVRGQQIKALEPQQLEELDLLPEHKLAIKTNLALLSCVQEQIKMLERELLSQAKLREDYQQLLTITGVGKVLALTIALESGDVARFDAAGNFASYARMVQSRRDSNGKTKGSGNAKCGNKYLSWAFIEAAHHAIRNDEAIKRFYQRKCAKSLQVVAIKAVAHKLARAAFHVMRDGTQFEVQRAFA